MKTYKIYKILSDNENGSAIVFAILILAVLTIIGISSITTSTIETKIDTNDRLYKQTFYEADGGTEVARELLEQNIACAGGFPNDDFYIGPSPFLKVSQRDFYLNTTEPSSDYPSAIVGSWDFYYPDTDNTDNAENFDVPHTKVKTFGNTILSTGSAIQMAAGYEGKGKSAAAGGAQIVYAIYSRHQGFRSSRSTIMINYRHIMGQEDICQY